MGIEPILITAAAAMVSSSGLLLESVRRVLSSILRQPSKNTLLVRYDKDQYASIDLDGDIHQRVVNAGIQRGLSEELAARLADTVLLQISGIRNVGDSSTGKSGEVEDVK